MLRLMEGEREHGLLLISRLASSFRFDPDQTDAPKYRGSVGCDVIEFNRPPLLTKRKDIGQICLHYTSPTVLWVGRDDSYVDFGQARIRAVPSPFERAIARAVKEKWLPVLRLYFGEISEATYILFEKTGRDVPSIAAGPGGPEGFKGTVRSAMEIFLENHFREQRVVFLAHRTMSPQDIEYWARDWDCPFFTSREDCERYLNEL
jgi:hypothetical protein